jgi:hypothetical protein
MFNDNPWHSNGTTTGGDPGTNNGASNLLDKTVNQPHSHDQFAESSSTNQAPLNKFIYNNLYSTETRTAVESPGHFDTMSLNPWSIGVETDTTRQNGSNSQIYQSALEMGFPEVEVIETPRISLREDPTVTVTKDEIKVRFCS